MASTAGEEVEYESDPEEVKHSLGMRRREAASDDEEVEEDAGSDNPRMDRRAPIDSDESDGQGAAADYDDDEDELAIEDEEEEEEEEVEMYNEEDEDIDGEDLDGLRKEEIQSSEGKGTDGFVSVVDGTRNVEEVVEGNHEGKDGEEEKKENEPFAVPTAGAFYMHDDRFRENVGGRHRRMHVGRKLWESKDDRKWGHDKYEEIELQEKQYEEGRRPSRGRYRGRSKNHGPDRSYPRGGRSRTFNKNSSQNQMEKGVRGRGPRRYEPSYKGISQATSTHNKQSGKLLEKSLQSNSIRSSAPAANAESVSGPAKNHGFASSLNSASPPFYPSGSSNKDIIWTQKRDLQAGNVGRNNQPSTSVTEANYSVSQDNPLRGKNAVEALGMEKLHIDDSTIPATEKPMSTLAVHPSVMTTVNTGQSSNSRVQGRGLTMSGQMSYQQAPVQVQAKRVSPATQLQAVPVQSKTQPYVQPPAQQLGQHPGTGSQASSPPKTGTLDNSYEPREVESPLETSKSKGALVGKVKGGVQGTGKGSFLYGGAQVMGTTGNMAVNHGDPNFPAFLPVMQFGGQHPGGIGVPAVGMAFPGYVAQPQLGLGNSEMTWLPVLTGAAGALGATYCPPYLAVDGSYHARPTGQPSSTGSSSKESNSNKPNNEWSSQRPEVVADEFVQRPNNPNKQPRRYSEMSFSK